MIIDQRFLIDHVSGDSQPSLDFFSHAMSITTCVGINSGAIVKRANLCLKQSPAYPYKYLEFPERSFLTPVTPCLYTGFSSNMASLSGFFGS